MTLPYDTARCMGHAHEVRTLPPSTALRAECVDCLRRTAPGHPTWQVQMEPPEFIAGRCPERIEPEYTPHIELLRKARARIANRKDMHVCVALSRADEFRKSGAKLTLQRWIQTSLRPYEDVGKWLLYKHGLDLDDVEIRQYRLAWIDQMIGLLQGETK